MCALQQPEQLDVQIRPEMNHDSVAQESGLGSRRVRVLRAVDELEELRPIWTSWQRHPNADMDLYLRTVRSLPGVIRPNVLVLDGADGPKALLLGRLEHGAVEVRIGYRSLIKCRARIMTFIHGGHLGGASPLDSEALMLKVLSLLKQREADAAFFNNIDTRSSIYQTATVMPGFLVRDHVPIISVHRKMLLSASESDFFQGLSSKHRKKLRWQVKKFADQFGPAVRRRCFMYPDELDVMFRDVEIVAKKTYQRGLGVGFHDDPDTRDRMAIAARVNSLRAHVLYIGDAPVAFWIGVLYHTTFHSQFMGYDPDYGKHSPGMFLILKVIEDLCNAKCSDVAEGIDFGLGDAQYKTVLGNMEWRDASFFMFAPSLTGVFLNALRTSGELLNRTGIRVAASIGLTTKIKRLWRDAVICREDRD